MALLTKQLLFTATYQNCAKKMLTANCRFRDIQSFRMRAGLI